MLITNHKALTYFKEKQHTSGHHIRWQNFFYGFKCDIIYVEGHKNKVADALSCYYKSSSDKDLHYDNFVSADIHINKLGDDLPLSQVEEAEEMLYFHCLRAEAIRIAVTCANTVVECSSEDHKFEVVILDPPRNSSGRSELTLTDIALPEENLRVVVEEDNFLTALKEGYSKCNAW